MTAPVASAPGKILLAGEYAVLDGAPAILTAVARRAVARLDDTPARLSPFLEAVRARLAERRGDASDAALAAARCVVDSSAFADDAGSGRPRKLGLGSSAAVTVAATAAALASGDAPVNRAEIHAIAHLAHGDGQAPRGSRGSGADIAASVYGGIIAARSGDPTGTAPLAVRAAALPDGVALIPVWTGTPASTGPLVAAVRAFRERDSATYERLIGPVAALADAIAGSGDGGATALGPAPFIDHVERAGRAIAELGAAAGVRLWLDAHSRVHALAQRVGGAAKPTGAGGGDLALIAVPSDREANLRSDLARAGWPPLGLARESAGVRIESPTSRRIHP